MSKTWGREDLAILIEVLEEIGGSLLLDGDPGVRDDGRHVGMSWC